MRSTFGIRAALVGGVSLVGLLAAPALAQTTAADVAVDAVEDAGIAEIVVTAQRSAQSLQDVPIAVSAFSAEMLQRQQIQNSSDLQLTLPNIVFTKGNFTGSSFTIRGIGDLCVGVTCDSATAIHVNGSPLIATRLFEAEFFDMERIEVLRGPQGTLFGRNATSGVINFITAKPDLNSFGAAGEVDYGNYNSIRLRGMVNVPVTDTLGVRLAGFYLQRDGFTENLYDDSRIDGRDMFGIRGSVRWEPTDNTRIDLMAYYFREDDDRSRIQKQQCQRDPTGVLGCLPGRRDFGKLNGNSTFVGVLSSREFLRVGTGALGPVLTNVGLGSLYGPDPFANFKEPTDVRQVITAFTPEYFAEEQQYQARIEHEFDDVGRIQVTGLYQSTKVDSRVDYNLGVQDPSIFIPGLTALGGVATAFPAFNQIAPALFPAGVNGPYCSSDTTTPGSGAFGPNGGSAICGAVPLTYDRSNEERSTWSIEAIFTSNLDGPINFLVGGIYLDSKLPENSYYVNGFGIDYVAGVLGGATGTATGQRGYLGTSFFRNNTDETTLKSYGLFGEVYWNITDAIKLTGGVRYNNDKKYVRARSTLASFFVPFGLEDPFDTPFGAGFDADPASPCPTPGAFVPGAIGSVPGCEAFQERSVGFDAVTGRIVADWQVSDESLIYASYSRGYKSGGINPPLQPIFFVPESFTPEFIDSFEIGSKNTFLDGTFRANLTAFYYKYSALQLSRIVARTSVNDNVNANVYGVEAEFVVQPIPQLAINMNASYLKTEVSQDKFLSNPRDPSGGRSDAVIIKDITNGSNCALVPTTAGNAAGANGFVGAVNSSLLLRAPAAFPTDSGINGATGAFSICNALAGAIAAPSAGLAAAFGTLANGTLPFQVAFAGVETNLRGNALPQAPEFKFSAGVQYTLEFGNGMNAIPRFDLAHTGPSFGNIFNGVVNRIDGYTVMNAQVQVNGKDDKWYLRLYVQNLSDNNATTGLYVTDQSSGLFTNIFTLEPRRFGAALGFRY